MEWVSFVRHLKRRWMSSGRFQLPISGCTDEEIDQLQTAQGMAYLPKLYREFMLQMGRDDGGLGKSFGAYLTYPYVFAFKTEQTGFAQPILQTFEMEQGRFVFCSDNDNFFYFFDARDMSDDPIVYNMRPNTETGQEFVIVELANLSAVLVDLVEFNFDTSGSGKEEHAPLD